jgi:hypothetical protein
MFRDESKSEINLKHFGAGSTILGSSTESWLVYAFNDNSGRVGLIDLVTMTCTKACVYVQDANHLTENEARHLVDTINDNYTFSDYTLVAKGLKLCRA